MVYHREKQLWYQRDKSAVHYSQMNSQMLPCNKVFNCEHCQFSACDEVLDTSDIISLNEINEYLKRAGWDVC